LLTEVRWAAHLFGRCGWKNCLIITRPSYSPEVNFLVGHDLPSLVAAVIPERSICYCLSNVQPRNNGGKSRLWSIICSH